MEMEQEELSSWILGFSFLVSLHWPRDSLDTISNSTSVACGRKIDHLYNFHVLSFSFILFLRLDLISTCFVPSFSWSLKHGIRETKLFMDEHSWVFPTECASLYIFTWNSRGDGPTVGEACRPHWAQPSDFSLGSQGPTCRTSMNEERGPSPFMWLHGHSFTVNSLPVQFCTFLNPDLIFKISWEIFLLPYVALCHRKDFIPIIS